jgi:ATP-dependent DNA helicase RecG
VVKEAIVNAAIHRDYRLNRDIFIRIFDDRIEVESPGTFPGNMTPENVGHMSSKARNPLIAQNLREFPVVPNIDAGEGFIQNAKLCEITKVDTLKASRTLVAWRDQGLLVPMPDRAKRNMAYAKPTKTGAEQGSLLSGLEDNNTENRN